MGEGGQISAKVPPKSARHPSDARLREISADRHHVFTLAELRAEGLSPRAVRDRMVAGRFERLYAGVYCTGSPTRYSRWLGAVRACGTGAVLSHRSAAALWGLTKTDGRNVDVTVPRRAGRARAGIAVHRGATVIGEDSTDVNGIPCTSLARSLLDYAAVMPPRTLELAFSQADVLRILDAGEIRAVLGRNPRHAGTKPLTTVLDAYEEPSLTRSALEEALFAALDQAGLPRPEVNAYIALDANTGYHPDLLWPGAKLIVEADSQTFHASREQRRHDARRDRRLKLAGYDTFRWVGDDPADLISHVSTYLLAED